MLVPWLRTLDATRGGAKTLLAAWAMSVAYSAAVFAWFGIAIGDYTQLGAETGIAGLLLVAPLFQPQFIAYALVRHRVGALHGAALRALAAASAWVATESFVPRLLGDTLGHGLYPSPLLRQAGDLGGATGLTLLLLISNEALSAAIARRADGIRAAARPLVLAALVPSLLAGYGLVALAAAAALPPGRPLRIGLVQSNIVDYERLRREIGAAAVVREVLDTHYAMSHDAVVRQHADAVLWSETVYPTTFGHPKSEAGAELDREILGVVDAAGVPFVFGTYDRDASGEYNAAAFVAPRSGLVGMYRKTRLFPLTESVPAWLDGPSLRRWLPWAGGWRAGDGARVFPLRVAGGAEVPVLPLICLDDMDPALAIDGARLGARALLTMSNDAWFTSTPQGAQLHQAAAAFRSIETRLPQFRVTTNGYSAVIDATGRLAAGARIGERTLVIGTAEVRDAPPRTLMLAWGDWVGRAGAVFLALLALWAAWRAWWRRAAAESSAMPAPPGLPADVSVLPPAARIAAGLLRVAARGGLLVMAAAWLLVDNVPQPNTLALLRTFGALVLAPEAAARCVLRAFAARASIEHGALVLTRGAHRLALAVSDIAAVVPWRLPLPGPGVALRLRAGTEWDHALAHADPAALARTLAVAGGPAELPVTASLAARYARIRGASRGGPLEHPLTKFVLLPLVLAIPAFRLHQVIAYGSGFGELYTFGATAYLTTFALWWASWAIGTLMCAAVLRAFVEAATLAALGLRSADAGRIRRGLDRVALAGLYLGVPAWLLLRLLAA